MKSRFRKGLEMIIHNEVSGAFLSHQHVASLLRKEIKDIGDQQENSNGNYRQGLSRASTRHRIL